MVEEFKIPVLTSKRKFYLELIIILFMLVSCSALAYNQGFYEGMSNICTGELVNHDGEVKCTSVEYLNELNNRNEPVFDLEVINFD